MSMGTGHHMWTGRRSTGVLGADVSSGAHRIVVDRYNNNRGTGAM
jgi:hypothetical protein